MRSLAMRHTLLRILAVVIAVWLVASVGVGVWLLPNLLLNVPVPQRTEAFRTKVRLDVLSSGGTLEKAQVKGGEDRNLELWHLRRRNPKGAVIYLHGFGDDIWGTFGRSNALPEWDAVGFTFRGRDANPSIPCTLGAWERADVVAAFHYLEKAGFPPHRIILAGWSMGAGVALLAMEDIEKEGKLVGGALLECPFEDLERAARDHIRGTLGSLEFLARLAEHLAVKEAGRLARFDPAEVSPVRSAKRVKSRVALISGDADAETPIDGVQRMALAHPDLTIVGGAGHCEASNRLPGGWETWAKVRLEAWGF